MVSDEMIPGAEEVAAAYDAMIPGAEEVAAAYDALARDYDALCPDWEAWAAQSYETLSRLLPNLKSASRILDCACGTGKECYALAMHGHPVYGCDASKGMLERATQRFKAAALDIPTVQCTWAQLPDQYEGMAFDIVLCWGNSISHCDSCSTLKSSLQGMAAVLSGGGTLAIETRDWERLVAEKPRFTVGRLRCYEGRQLIPVYIWDVEGMWQPSKVEILFLELEGETVRHRSYVLPMQPIPYDDLSRSLEEAGLRLLGREPAMNEGRYVLLASKP
jgi:SAM-dependent methyltransferase